MSRFKMTDYDRAVVDRARQAVASRTDVGSMDDIAMARRIGRLEVVVESLLEVVDSATTPAAGVEQ